MIMIQEVYCSFEVSKLLKEKGFNGECSGFYMLNGSGRWKYEHYHNFDISDRIDCPTHQMAMAWLREKYDLHIIAYPWNANGKKKWCCQVYKTFNLLGCEKYVNETLDSYEEAIEAALKYTLTNQ